MRQQVLLLQDNDARLASLIHITSVQLDDVLSAIAADPTFDSAYCRKLVGFSL